MPYATQDDLVPQRLTIQQLVQLTAVVDSYCGQRYTLPLHSSNLATEFTADIATYRLFARRGQVKDGSAQQAAYRDALAHLKDIGNGKATLDVPANETPQSSSGPVLVTEIPQVFAGVDDAGWL